MTNQNDNLPAPWFQSLVKAGDPEMQVNLAAAILLVGIVKADGRIEREEIAKVIDTLVDHFGLSSDEAGLVLELASDTYTQEHNLHTLAIFIRDAWTSEQRAQLLEGFWDIAISDRSIDLQETVLIENLANTLNLTKDEIQTAHMLAKSKLASSNSQTK